MMTIAGEDRTQLVAPTCAPLNEAPSTGKLVASVVVFELGHGEGGRPSKAVAAMQPARQGECRKFQRRTPFRVAIGEKRP